MSSATFLDSHARRSGSNTTRGSSTIGCPAVFDSVPVARRTISSAVVVASFNVLFRRASFDAEIASRADITNTAPPRLKLLADSLECCMVGVAGACSEGCDGGFSATASASGTGSDAGKDSFSCGMDTIDGSVAGAEVNSGVMFAGSRSCGTSGVEASSGIGSWSVLSMTECVS